MTNLVTAIFYYKQGWQRPKLYAKAGPIFTMDGPFNAEIVFSFSTTEDECYFHTLCSAPLIVGDQLGPFKILSGSNNCNIASADEAETDFLITNPTTPGEHCKICSQDNKVKPNKLLTLQYQSNGQTSQYQDSSKTCLGRAYIKHS
jgi:hypothetical protein